MISAHLSRFFIVSFISPLQFSQRSVQPPQVSDSSLTLYPQSNVRLLKLPALRHVVVATNCYSSLNLTTPTLTYLTCHQWANMNCLCVVMADRIRNRCHFYLSQQLLLSTNLLINVIHNFFETFFNSDQN